MRELWASAQAYHKARAVGLQSAVQRPGPDHVCTVRRLDASEAQVASKRYLIAWLSCGFLFHYVLFTHWRLTYCVVHSRFHDVCATVGHALGLTGSPKEIKRKLKPMVLHGCQLNV